jgi:hypothetical protein
MDEHEFFKVVLIKTIEKMRNVFNVILLLFK